MKSLNVKETKIFQNKLSPLLKQNNLKMALLKEHELY